MPEAIERDGEHDDGAGDDLLERTRLEAEDLVSVLNGLMEVGYAEMNPYAEHTDEQTFRDKLFEVNPSYALELRAAMSRL